MKTFKNWWLQILTILLVILDLGFDLINPLLVALSTPENWIVVMKIIYGIAVVIRSKIQLPTHNVNELQEIINSKK